MRPVIEQLAQEIRLAWHKAEAGHESFTLEPWEKIGERRKRKWLAAAEKAHEIMLRGQPLGKLGIIP